MNTTSIARYEPLADEQVGLIKRMIAKDASNDELQLFLHQCQRTGLDPFSKQIYAISRYSKEAGRKVMAIQVSIDGARLIAERTGKYDNQEGPFWCGDDGVWKDVWLSQGAPRAAKVLVYKVGSNRATTGIAHWEEYHDPRSSFWQSKPALMLAKCAEMLALRKAFPQELSGLYAQEEMPEAETIEVTARRVEPSTGEIVDNPVDNDVPFETRGEYENAEQLLSVFNTLGLELYGDSWEQVCRRNVKRISGGEAQFVDELSAEQLQKLVDGLWKLQEQRKPEPQATA